MRQSVLASILASLILAACGPSVLVSTSSGSGAGGGSSGGPGGGPSSGPGSTSSSGAGSTSSSGTAGSSSGGPSFVRFSQTEAWCAVRGSGEVVCWHPVFGLDSAQPPGVMTTVPGVDDAIAVAVQPNAACALRASGKVACWGKNHLGELGSLPKGKLITEATDLPGVEGIAVSCSMEGTCVLRANGRVACFGLGTDEPTDIPGLFDAVAITGGFSGCALRANGSVVCWSDFNFAPAPIPSLHDAVSISMSGYNGCAARANGKVFCWSQGTWGMLIEVPGFSNVVRVNAGKEEICGIDQAGDVYCWPWWGADVTPVGLHDARDFGHDDGQRCVLHTDGALECGGVSGM